MTQEYDPQDSPSRDEDIALRAREWLLLLDSGYATEDDRQRFARWLAIDTLHASAYRRQKALWQSAAQLAGLAALEPRARVPQPSYWGWGLASAALLLVAVLLSPIWPETQRVETYATNIAETRDIQLTDGSRLTLGPASQLQVEMTQQVRRVTLLAGEAFFDVHREPARPFVIHLDAAHITVLGTRFNVHHGEELATVSVAEGRVRVDSDLGTLQYLELVGGEQARISRRSGLQPASAVEPQATDAWRRGLRIYNATPLSEVIADLHRYGQRQLILEDVSLAQLPVTAVFPSQDVDLALQALAQVLPIELVNLAPDRVVLRRR